jgi:hypothetical protein
MTEDSLAVELRHRLAGRLMSILSAVETPEWVWFEEELAYDNARLPQALNRYRNVHRSCELCRRWIANPALAHETANE